MRKRCPLPIKTVKKTSHATGGARACVPALPAHADTYGGYRIEPSPFVITNTPMLWEGATHHCQRRRAIWAWATRLNREAPQIALVSAKVQWRHDMCSSFALIPRPRLLRFRGTNPCRRNRPKHTAHRTGTCRPPIAAVGCRRPGHHVPRATVGAGIVRVCHPHHYRAAGRSGSYKQLLGAGRWDRGSSGLPPPRSALPINP